ncbi:MAG TPA: hypothetical protein VG939_03840, partial [Caulobacteraceae bacterium]|nr:hypothetical protein [Caulobacteraceae bacterium]
RKGAEVNPLLLVKLLSPRAWAVAGVALVLAFAGLQSARLAHAKADQRDPRTHGLWRDEARIAREAAARSAAALAQAQAESSDLKTALAEQNADVARTAEAGRRASAAADAALAMQRRAAESAEASARQVLASRPQGEPCAAADRIILGSLP